MAINNQKSPIIIMNKLNYFGKLATERPLIIAIIIKIANFFQAIPLYKGNFNEKYN